MVVDHSKNIELILEEARDLGIKDGSEDDGVND